MLAFLARLGSRSYFVAGLVTSLILFARGCANEVSCEGADCNNPPGSGVFCGGKECPMELCAKPGSIRCDEGEVTCSAESLDELNDGNACTVDACDPETGIITHTPYTAEDLDDGIDCTIDECSPGLGIRHVDDCP